jgi:hypothetical protein
MFAKISTLSAVLCVMTTACTLADQTDDLSSVELEGKTTPAKAPGSTTPPPTGPTCPVTTDYASDPANCGICGTVCGSGLCYAGVCADATAGHVFAIGHGYATSNAALDKVLGNAVFMNERTTVRVLAYAGQAPASMVAGANAAMDRYAAAHGRTIQRTVITGSADVAVNLPNADVFVVYPLTQAPSDYLMALGGEWAYRLDSFARRGGTIVVLDAPSSNTGTAQVLVTSGLMSLTARANAGGVAFIGNAEDVASARIPLMFALNNSIGWAPSSWSNVAATETGQSVVVHRAIY